MPAKTTIRLLLQACALLALTSCDIADKKNITEICDDAPELCSDTHKIHNCRYKRTSLIRARYYDKEQPSKQRTIDLLDRLSEYEACVELTLFMQYTRDNGRKQKRIDNLLTTQKLMKEKLAEVKGTKDPHIAYYLWTHFQDLDAKKVFITAALKKDADDPILLLKLASLYSKNYPQHSLDLFYKALTSSHTLENIPPHTFTSIMTIYYQHKNFEQAYIWALIANEASSEEPLPINFELILQEGMINQKKTILNEHELKETADSFYQQLLEGKFHAQPPKLSEE